MRKPTQTDEQEAGDGEGVPNADVMTGDGRGSGEAARFARDGDGGSANASDAFGDGTEGAGFNGNGGSADDG